MQVQLKEHNESERFTLRVSTESRDNKTYIVINGCSKKATHILVFKWKSGIFAPKDVNISDWGSPVSVFDRQELIHSWGGKASVGGNAGEYLISAARRDENGVYHCDKFTAVIVDAGDHNTVWYSINYSRQNPECDKVTVSFKPTLKENNANFIPFSEIFYTVSHHINLKYPISDKMMKNDMFEIFVPRDCRIRLDCTDGSRVKVSEAR